MGLLAPLLRPAAAPSERTLPPDVMRHLGEYPVAPRDPEDRFWGKRLLYVSWENHLMYCAPFCLPVPSTLPFGALVRDVLPELYGEHPEFESIDWHRTVWNRSGRRFVPDFGKSLAHHGLDHKAFIRFRTPRLEGARTRDADGRQQF